MSTREVYRKKALDCLLAQSENSNAHKLLEDLSAQVQGGTDFSAALAAVSMVTVAPSTIVTLSAAVGTTPPTQVAVALQFPPRQQATSELEAITDAAVNT